VISVQRRRRHDGLMPGESVWQDARRLKSQIAASSSQTLPWTLSVQDFLSQLLIWGDIIEKTISG
jgi:hypothetical protein